MSFTSTNNSMTNLTLGEFRKLTAGLPYETPIAYHSYYKGRCLSSHTTEDVWLFPKDEAVKRAIVINPGPYYDARTSRTTNED